MKYKKLGKILIVLVSLVSLFFFIPTLRTVVADSGWDSDFDSDFGSDFDYDYDYDYDSDYDYYGSDDTPVEDITSIVAIIFILTITLVIADIVYKQSKHKGSHHTFNDISDEELQKFVSGLSIKELKDLTYKTFLDIQDGWMNFDYDKIRNLCTYELYNAYKTQLETLKLKNGKNIMSDFSLNEIKVINVSDYNGIINVEMYMDIEMHDYVINTKTNKITRGNKDRIINNNYLMTFVKTNKQLSGEIKCPNCGAKVDLNTSAKCEYCGSTIVKDANEFVLSKKRVIK